MLTPITTSSPPLATLVPGCRYDSARLAEEALAAISQVRQIQLQMPDVQGWINFFLGNQSGDFRDMRLENYPGSFHPTTLAQTMPYIMSVIHALAVEGFAFQYCRIAVIEGRSLLRCHVDMYRSARLILPLTRQGSDFRHLFEHQCFFMTTGELWAINGDVCHGAANIAPAGYRVALLLDAHDRPDSLPGWWRSQWSIPTDRLIQRPAWTDQQRTECRMRAEQFLSTGDTDAAEQVWLFAPFEYELLPADGYAELIRFCTEKASSSNPEQAQFWSERHAYWINRNCRCA